MNESMLSFRFDFILCKNIHGLVKSVECHLETGPIPQNCLNFLLFSNVNDNDNRYTSL